MFAKDVVLLVGNPEVFDLSTIRSEAVFLFDVSKLTEYQGETLRVYSDDVSDCLKAYDHAAQSNFRQIRIFWNSYLMDGMSEALANMFARRGGTLHVHGSGVLEMEFPFGDSGSEFKNVIDAEVVANLQEIASSTYPVSVQDATHLRAQLHVLLEQIDSLETQQALWELVSKDNKSQGGSDGDSVDSLVPKSGVATRVSDARFESLIKENQRLTHSLEIAEQKYDALAKSKLGSLTLKYWDARRK